MAPETETTGREVTRLLQRWRDGDGDALDGLLPLLYEELRTMARHCLRRERADHLLQASALVHEAYLRLHDKRRARIRDRAHFFSVVVQAMRRVLLDHGRRLQASKRRGNLDTVSFDAVPFDHGPTLSAQPMLDYLALDQALAALAAIDPRQARVVELRYLAGLTIDETAEALDLSASTVERFWRLARIWLRERLQG
ncbi:MAG: ECF-type sigma factor [Acidobacteriota bacterium]